MKGINFHYSYSKYLMSMFILMLVFCDLAGSKAQAQSSSILIYNDTTKSFNPNKELPPFGIPIIVKGYASNELKKVTITVSYGITVQKVNATISDNMWTATVGPFPKHATVKFEIEMERKLSDSEQNEIVNKIVININDYINNFLKENSAKTRDAFIADLQTEMRSKLNKLNSNFTTSTHEPLDSVIIQQINSLFVSDTIATDLNNLKNIDRIKQMPIYNFFDNHQESDSIAKDIIYRISNKSALPNETVLNSFFEEFRKNAPDDLRSANLKNSYITLLKKYNAYRISYKKIDSLFNKLNTNGKEIVSRQTVTVSATISQDIKGIESYIGIDLGLNYIPKLAQTPPLASFSVYLRRVDPEVDYNIRNMSKDFWYILYYLTPTVGVALNNQYSDNKIKPIYMVGLGLRLNKAVRINGGYCYYLPENATKYNGSWTVGISISSNYIADLLQSFTALQANVSNK